MLTLCSDNDVLLLFEAVDTRDPAVSLPDLLCGRVSEQDSAVGRRDPVTDGCEPDWCNSSEGRCDSEVCGRDRSLGECELLVDGRDPVTVDTRDSDCDPVLLPVHVLLPFAFAVLLEASFTDDLLDSPRLSLSLCLLVTRLLLAVDARDDRLGVDVEEV